MVVGSNQHQDRTNTRPAPRAPAERHAVTRRACSAHDGTPGGPAPDVSAPPSISDEEEGADGEGCSLAATARTGRRRRTRARGSTRSSNRSTRSRSVVTSAWRRASTPATAAHPCATPSCSTLSGRACSRRLRRVIRRRACSSSRTSLNPGGRPPARSSFTVTAASPSGPKCQYRAPPSTTPRCRRMCSGIGITHELPVWKTRRSPWRPGRGGCRRLARVAPDRFTR
jgi:hypothetical protein